jgi:hypothetical protein
MMNRAKMLGLPEALSPRNAGIDPNRKMTRKIKMACAVGAMNT